MIIYDALLNILTYTPKTPSKPHPNSLPATPITRTTPFDSFDCPTPILRREQTRQHQYARRPRENGQQEADERGAD